jgi:hypothetical protein
MIRTPQSRQFLLSTAVILMLGFLVLTLFIVYNYAIKHNVKKNIEQSLSDKFVYYCDQRCVDNLDNKSMGYGTTINGACYAGKDLKDSARKSCCVKLCLNNNTVGVCS